MKARSVQAYECFDSGSSKYSKFVHPFCTCVWHYETSVEVHPPPEMSVFRIRKRIRIRFGFAFDGRPNLDPGAKMKEKTQPKDR
jgi:hypothetical protein